jgi:hypothetical protein
MLISPFDLEKRCADRKKLLHFEKIARPPMLKISTEIIQRDFDLCSYSHSTLGEPS